MTELHTEERHPETFSLDQMTIREIAERMNEEDATVIHAIREQLPAIEKLIEIVIKQLKKGGRLFYIGAGTSGRLGVLDAAECVPTFNTPPEKIQGLIAGGEQAILQAVEGAEDSYELGEKDLKEKQLSSSDMVIGIAASGKTPYVVGALDYANKVGAQTGSISNNSSSELSKKAHYPVEVVTGPEVLTGSTRLKAGTAQKLVLNMISTIAMVHLGKVYENLMVDVQPTNNKLIDRSKRMVMEVTGVSYEEAGDYLERSGGSVKLAIVQLLSGATLSEAKETLEHHDGKVREALRELKSNK